MNHMSVGILLVVVILALGVFGREAKDDLKPLQGNWIPVEGEFAGERLTQLALENFELMVKEGGEYIAEVGGVLERGTIKVDALAMDFIGLEGPKNKGKFLAIYELSGDRLTICYDLSGTYRPTEFKTRPTTQLLLVTYKREKT